jgi:hypothetical protein
MVPKQPGPGRGRRGRGGVTTSPIWKGQSGCPSSFAGQAAFPRVVSATRSSTRSTPSLLWPRWPACQCHKIDQSMADEFPGLQNAGPAVKIVAEFEETLKTHPPIAPGTPDSIRGHSWETASKSPRLPLAERCSDLDIYPNWRAMPAHRQVCPASNIAHLTCIEFRAA